MRKNLIVSLVAAVALFAGGVVGSLVSQNNPAWAAYIGALKLLDYNGTNQAAVDSSHRLSVSCDNGCAPAGSTVKLLDYGGTNQAAVDAAHRVAVTLDNPNGEIQGTASTTGTSDTSVIAASGSGSLKNCITGGVIANSGSTNATISIKDGSGGSVLLTTVAPATFGGSNFSLKDPICGTANTATYFAASAASTTIYVTLTGYKGL